MAATMFIIVVLLIQMTIGSFGQGIFDPFTFTQSSCSGSNEWTVWLDSGDPDLANGEFEVINHLVQKFPAFMCSAPIGIEVSASLLLLIRHSPL